MPVYTIYHRFPFGIRDKQGIAAALTNLHSSVTGTSPQAVKVIFIALLRYSFFSGGKPVNYYVRMIAQIREGRNESQKKAILSGAFEILLGVVQGSWYIGGRRVKSLDDCEIQTQVVEIDDVKTVMTNGLMNN